MEKIIFIFEFWFLGSENQVKFTEVCVMFTQKLVFYQYAKGGGAL